MSKEKSQKNKEEKTKQVQNNNNELELALNEEKERRLKVMADFENYKKRMETEKATFGAIANMGLIQQILEIHDDMQMAMDDQELDLERAKESIKNAQSKIQGAVLSAGVERIEVKPGDDFDKDIMEAIQAIPDEKNKNKVIAVISSAYKYTNKDGIIKSAKVIVGK